MEKLTDLQVQAALIFLGYHPGAADGIAGAQTRGALGRFAEDYGLAGQDEAVIRGALAASIAGRLQRIAASEANADDTQGNTTGNENDGPFAGIRYFRPAEFACRCAGLCRKDTAAMAHRLLVIDDQIREHFGRPVTITSGIRCPQHNANVGGVYNSRHLTGHANDLTVAGYGSEAVLAYIKTLPGVNYAYAIDGSAVHVDTL